MEGSVGVVPNLHGMIVVAGDGGRGERVVISAPPEGTEFVAESVRAEEAINGKWEALGGSPGAPLHPGGPEGLLEVPHGFRRHYDGGSIYRRNWGLPFFLGPPTDQRYDQLGGPGRYLGFPISDFEPDPEEPGSGVTRFENGAIYFWPDVGAIEMREVSVRYVGFHCFGETGEWSDSDEIYFTFGVAPTLVEHRNTVQTGIIGGVDAGETRSSGFEPVELYRGLPFGAAISITLVEHDDGDPNKYRDNVEIAVEKTADKIVEGLAAVPVVGVPLAVIATFVFVLTGPAITDAVNELLGTEDDLVGSVGLPLTPKDMMRLTRVGRQDFHGLQAHIESPLISGDGASYKAYFDIEG